MVKLRVKNLTKVYNGKKVLDNITFSVEDGEFLSILGSSGCGKTTLLRIIIGIESPTEGKITKNRKIITNEDPARRGMGIVFQDYALFPNMTVLGNVMYALNIKLKNKEKAKEESLKMLEMVNMEAHIKKYPHELSGGQKQRVAIAGIIAMRPKCIIFDEATAMLDPSGRKEVMNVIEKLNKEENITVLHITHYMEEAVEADRVIVMDKGRKVLEGTPKEVFRNVKMLKEIGLDVPYMTELATSLKEEGIDINDDILTVDEMVVKLCQLL